jgi:hypothetical protein
MNQESRSTQSRAGKPMSENAVRGALHRRARTVAIGTTDGPDGRLKRPAPAADASPQANRSQRLRRWSVAELTARAFARPPTGGAAHECSTPASSARWRSTAFR